MAEPLMRYNSDTGELTCYAPAGELVLRTVELDIEKAHQISSAIQSAYRKGRTLGQLDMQHSIERHMDSITG